MKRFYHIPFVLVLLIGLGLSLSPAAGAAEGLYPWVSTDMSRTRLIPARTGTGNGAEILLGLHIQLDRGWKTYWRSPGDSGLPPEFKWSETDNIKSVDVLWPKPSPFRTYGFLTWGYQNEVVFPIKITLIDPEKGLDAKLNVFYGICSEICVPVNQDFSINLPADQAQLTAEANIIEYFQSLVPLALDASSPVQDLAFYSMSDDSLTVEVRTNQAFLKPALILEGQDGDFFTVTETVVSEGGKVAKFTVETRLANREASLKGRRFTATILDASFAVEGQALVE